MKIYYPGRDCECDADWAGGCTCDANWDYLSPEDESKQAYEVEQYIKQLEDEIRRLKDVRKEEL